MNNKQYQVWECKIVVPKDAVIPDGFDLPPRRAAIAAVCDANINVVACFSGWGGKLTQAEQEIADAYYEKDRVPAPTTGQ